MSEVGVVGWAVAGATALAFDVLADQTMSQWFRERFRDEHTRPLAIGFLALSAYHLTRPDSWPFQNLDPITQAGKFIKEHVEW